MSATYGTNPGDRMLELASAASRQFDLTCVECSASFASRHRNAQVCGRACLVRRGGTLPCIGCAKPFRPRVVHGSSCSSRCASTAAQRRINAERAAGLRARRARDTQSAAQRKPCGICGAALRYNYSSDPHCRLCRSLKLRRDTRLRRAKARQAAALRGTRGKHVVANGTCTMCGNAFNQVLYLGRIDTCCSSKCYRRLRSQTKRAIKQAIRQAIFERDGWRCGLCGKPVSKVDRVPHPRSATVDHIVPRVDGGDDCPANLRTAHFRCNSARGNRGVPEQLRLVG